MVQVILKHRKFLLTLEHFDEKFQEWFSTGLRLTLAFQSESVVMRLSVHSAIFISF